MRGVGRPVSLCVLGSSVVLALTLVALRSPAYASCGDWLDDSHTLVLPLLRLVDSPESDSASKASIPSPCRSGECRKAPVERPPVVPPSIQDLERLCWWPSAVRLIAGDGASWLLVEETPLVRTIYLEPADPPPRS
ncbi:MAG: hypothetical protein KatS3mg109_1382 [Pirellulaceae bacterium]|nr:MAG: hypothetical protein KatS3mg109_1382 [Pirellulaceae bacterium]GIW93702.1 MAG: hypothetical protein KatS3mg110_1743 [Pirellulaceae bacterium]